MAPAVMREELEQMKGLWVFLLLYVLLVSSLQRKSQAVQHRQLQAGEYIAWREMRFGLWWSHLWGGASKASLLLLLQEITSFVPRTVSIELSAIWGKGQFNRENKVVITVTGPQVVSCPQNHPPIPASLRYCAVVAQ